MMVVVANDGHPVQTMEETDTIVLSGGQRVEFMVRFDTPGNCAMIRQAWKIVPSLEACQGAFEIPVCPCVSCDIDQIVAAFVVTETVVAVEKNLLPLIDTIALPTPACPDSLISLAAQESVDRKTIAMQQSFASPLFQVPAVEGADLGGIPTGFGMNDRQVAEHSGSSIFCRSHSWRAASHKISLNRLSLCRSLATPCCRHGSVTSGTCETWDILSDPPMGEHSFHTHAADFLVTPIDGVEVEEPFWRDAMMVVQNIAIHVCFDHIDAGEVLMVHCHIPSHLGTF